LPGWLESLIPRIVVKFLMDMFKDWRRAGELKDLGAAEQANAAAAEAEKRGQEGDAIDIQVEAASDDDLIKMVRGDK
jgi:hypothetical protein